MLQTIPPSVQHVQPKGRGEGGCDTPQASTRAKNAKLSISTPAGRCFKASGQQQSSCTRHAPAPQRGASQMLPGAVAAVHRTGSHLETLSPPVSPHGAQGCQLTFSSPNRLLVGRGKQRAR